MIAAFSLLVLCQLVGEFFVRITNLPIPGPVIGLVLLVCGLAWRGRVPDAVEQTSRGLLSHLSLLFVPAGTGVMLHAHRLETEWLPILVALVAGTGITLIVTAFVFVAVSRWTEERPVGSER